MSLNNIADLYPNTLSGLSSFNANQILINGVDISTIYVPFINSPSDVDLADKNLTTTGRVQTTVLKLPSVSYSTTKVLRVNASKEVESIDLATVYVPYTGATNDLDMGGYRVYSLSAPLVANELVNKQYVDSNFPNYTYVQLNYLSIATAQSDYVPYNYATNNITLGSYTVYTNKVPSAGGEVVNKTYVDTTFPTFGFVSSTYAPKANPTFTGTVSGITKAMVGLANVDNTSDLNKPISTATQTALNLKADLASPALTGIPTAPTASAGTNTIQIATTAFVTSAIGAGGVTSFSAGSTGFTPNTATTGAIVLAGTLNVANGGTGVTTSTGSTSVVLSASPTLTGIPLAPTASAGTNTTQIATTAFVTTAVSAVGIPTQINATAINTSVSLYPAWFQSIAGGSSTVYVESDGSLFYNPSTNRLTVPIVSATSVVETATVQNSSGQTVTINAQGGAIAGNRINLQIQSTNYYYFDKDAFYLTQPVNNVISSITNDLYLLWPSAKLLSFNNWATFDNTGFFMASTRKIQSQTFETQPSQNLTLNVPTATNLINFNFNGNTRACATDNGFWLPVDGTRSIYFTDTAPNTATATYNRFFATGGTVYNDFYNIFQWRVYPSIGPLSGLADIMKLKSTGLTITKSSNSHSTLANYELVVGDNSSGTNTSAKILVRGNSNNAALCPSIDFTSYNTHTTIQGSMALYDDNNWGGIFAFIVKPYGAGAGGASQSVMEIRATNTNVGRLTFPTTYYVDLYMSSTQIGGFANPSNDIPLKITASYNVTGAYWFYGGGPSWSVVTFTAGSPQPMSILAYGTISANSGFSVASDYRIKKDIQPAEHGALQVIDKIPIKSYDLIDNYRDGLKTSFNIIAQEVLQVYPEAVSKGVSFIPNIYTTCKWITVSPTEIEIHIDKPHELITGDEIEIILEDNSIKECDVTAITDTNTFRVTKWDDFKLEITDECFIYGKKVKDFLRIDKTKVAMLGLAGTKELHQIVKQQQTQIQAQQAKIEEQSQAINTLTESMKTLTDHLAKLTNAFNEIVKEK